MDRHIIHLNVADFAVAVERTLDRRLRNRPVIVAPEGGARTVVYDMSQEAYMAGVRKGMALSMAIRRVPDAAVRVPHAARYEQAMGDLAKQALPFTPLIEPGPDDGHLFLDVTGTRRLFGPAADVAWRLRRRIRTDLGLDPIWSVATNKLVAKVATRTVKPDGESVVAPGDEAAFLSPLPLCLIPGVDRDDLLRLGEFNLTRVCHVTALAPVHLETLFGTRSRFIHESVRGIDASPVRPADRTHPAVAENHAFGRDTNTPAEVEAVLYRLVEQAGRKLRQQRLAARRIGLILDHSDGVRRARQTAPKPATANDLTLFSHARRILESAWTRRVRIRHMRLICDRLVFPPAQMALFADTRRETRTRDNLVAAIDRIRTRFGTDMVRFAREPVGPFAREPVGPLARCRLAL